MRSRRTARVTVVAVALVLTTLVLAAPASATGGHHRVEVLHARMTGAAEVPGPGDTDGRGAALLVVEPESGRICYLLHVRRIDPATAAHIHIGDAETAGPVVQGLEPPTDGASAACVTNAELATQLIADPGGYYVNVHNAAFPAGAIRGQLR